MPLPASAMCFVMGHPPRARRPDEFVVPCLCGEKSYVVQVLDPEPLMEEDDA